VDFVAKASINPLAIQIWALFFKFKFEIGREEVEKSK